MKKSINYLDEAELKLGGISDYKLAKVLNIQQSTMSRYRTGERTIDDYAAAQIAKILDINELIVISIANAEREKTVERVEFWKEKYNSLKGFSSLSLLIMTGLSSIALLALFAMHSICILC